MRWTLLAQVLVRRTKRSQRTAKSCGPGAATLALRWRKSSTGSDLGEVSPLANGLLATVVAAERYLPVKSWPGVSLMLRARRP